LAGNNITDLGILRLSKVISSLTKLDTILLNFDELINQGITGKNLSQLLKSFEGLPVLTNVQLIIKCLEIDKFYSKMLVSNLRNLKALNQLKFHLRPKTEGACIIKYLERYFQQLEKKLDADFLMLPV